MRCDEVQATFSDLYDEVLSGPRLVTIAQHLASCPACQEDWAAFRKAMRAMSDLGGAEPSPGFAARVRERIETPTRVQHFLRVLFFPLRVKVPIQAVALLVVGSAGLLLYQQSPKLRQAAEFRPAVPPPVATEPALVAPAPAASPEGELPAAPPAGQEAAQQAKRRPPGDARTMARRAAPETPAPGAPRPQDRLKSDQDRPSSAMRDEAREDLRPAAPLITRKPEEAPGERREKLAAPGPGIQALPGAVSAPTQPAAPAKVGRASSLSARPGDANYSTAQKDMTGKRYDQAIENFRAFLTEHPRDSRVAEARLGLADAYYAQQKYREAIVEYETIARQFPESPLVPAALYRSGLARLDLGDRSGCLVLRDLAIQHPEAPEAELARASLSARCP